MPDNENAIYLTFDDGPHPIITPFVLNQLSKYNAKATFFCTGLNVLKHAGVYDRMLSDGHAIGNHTFNHVNGWKTKDNEYIKDILTAEQQITSKLFRPPYGRFTRSQQKRLTSSDHKFSIVMWSVLSGDFDVTISSEKCYENVIRNTGNGAIVVFHDSEKAFKHLSYALPKVLAFFSEKGYQFKAINM